MMRQKISVSGLAAESLVINFGEHYAVDHLYIGCSIVLRFSWLSKLKFQMAAQMDFEL